MSNETSLTDSADPKPQPAPATLNTTSQIELIQTHPFLKYVYHPNFGTCLTRLISLSIRRFYAADCMKDQTTLFERIKKYVCKLLPAFPGVTLKYDYLSQRFTTICDQYEKDIKKYKTVEPWLLGFALDKVIAETIPASDLVITSKNQTILPEEVSYIAKTLLLLLMKDVTAARGYSKCDNLNYKKQISNTYFLGDYKEVKEKKVDVKDITPLEAYRLGYSEALASVKKRKKNDYPDEYRDATGRELNRHKFATITKLLAKHNFITREAVPADQDPYNTVVIYGLNGLAAIPKVLQTYEAEKK